MPRPVIVVEYDPAWPEVFERLRGPIARCLRGLDASVEHMGSTSVPGLAAKAIIDIDVVVPSEEAMHQCIVRMATIGYEHRGDLGVAGRQAFRAPSGLPDHHLYACIAGARALRNHLLLRDLLRADADAARRYGELKRQLAGRYRGDIDSYIWGKTALVLDLLRAGGMSEEDLSAIEAESAAATGRT